MLAIEAQLEMSKASLSGLRRKDMVESVEYLARPEMF